MIFTKLLRNYLGINVSKVAKENLHAEKPLSEQAEKRVAVGDFNLYANESHLVEYYLANYKYYSRNLARIAKYISGAFAGSSVIDVGANIGDSIALMRSGDCKNFIYAIEGDKNYFKLLKKNADHFFENVNPLNFFLGESNAKIKSDLDATGGTLNLKENKSSESTVDIITLDDLIAANKIQNIKLIKIDTDGFDFMILRGGLKTIESQKPVLFFEYDEKFLTQNKEDGIETLMLLKKLGYQKIIYYDNYGRYLLSTKLENQDMLEELYLYTSNRQGCFPYYDVCLFHAQDNNLADAVISNEKKYFRNN